MDDGRSTALGLEVLEDIAWRISSDDVTVAAGERPVRRRPFPVAQRPFASAEGQPRPLRGARHADRLRFIMDNLPKILAETKARP